MASLTLRVSSPPTESGQTMKALTRSLFAPLALLMLSSFVPAASAADIQGKEMTLPATERAVKVEFFRAPGNAKRPTVLMLHGGQGWGGAEGRTENFRQYGSELANHGFDAYMVYYYSDSDIADRKANAPGVSGRRFPAWAKLVSDLTSDAKTMPDSNGKQGLAGFSNTANLPSHATPLDTTTNPPSSYHCRLSPLPPSA